MIAEKSEIPFSSSPEEQVENCTKDTSCQNFKALTEWQIQNYRNAVNENQWYLGERLEREVTWAEAEQDFLENGYYGCAERWRSEYCSSICSFREDCVLGHQLCQCVS